MANALTIVDLPQDEDLPASRMTHVVGGRDIAKEKAIIEAYKVIHDIDTLLNEPDPAPAHVSMKL